MKAAFMFFIFPSKLSLKLGSLSFDLIFQVKVHIKVFSSFLYWRLLVSIGIYRHLVSPHFLSFAFKVGCGCILVFAELLLSTFTHFVVRYHSITNTLLIPMNTFFSAEERIPFPIQTAKVRYARCGFGYILQDLEGRLHTLNNSSWNCSVSTDRHSDFN